MKRPTPAKVRIAARHIGEHVATWRKLQGLSTELVSSRASISRQTLWKIEKGDPSVSFESVLRVLAAIGQLQRLPEFLDPYETELGRARADEQLPQRIRS